MKTYKYHFPAYGSFVSMDDAEEFKDSLESHLKEGQNCLGAWCIFSSDSAVLDHISFDMDEKHAVTGINLHTYTKLEENCEIDLRACVEENLSNVIGQRFDDYDSSDYFHLPGIDGDVEFLGMEGEMPKTLYHIAEKNYLDQILKNGINLENGSYGYMNDKTAVYLCEKEQLATWLAVLKHNENPVIMEVDTEGLNIETGRVYKDRGFAPEGYAEYCATGSIPASAIKEAELTGRFCAELHADMCELGRKFASSNEFQEINTGMRRLNDMGILENADLESRIEVANERGIPEVGAYEEGETHQDDLDDLSRALDRLPTDWVPQIPALDEANECGVRETEAYEEGEIHQDDLDDLSRALDRLPADWIPGKIPALDEGW